MDIDNDQVRLHVEIDGADRAPALLMMHGITMSGRTWDWVVPDLVDRFRVLRLDFRGHGRSGRAPGAYQPADYVSDAVAVIEQVAGGPCLVVGHSLGGMTAAALAQQRPELVLGAVLEDPPLGVVNRALEGNSLRDGFALMRESVPRLQAQQIPRDVLAGILAKAPSPAGPPFGELLHADALDVMAETMLQLDATVLDGVVGGTTVATYVPAQGIPVPALVVGADPASPDAVVRPADAALLREVTPHVEIQVVSGASHLLHDELLHRDDFRRLLLGFLHAHAPAT